MEALYAFATRDSKATSMVMLTASSYDTLTTVVSWQSVRMFCGRSHLSLDLKALCRIAEQRPSTYIMILGPHK